MDRCNENGVILHRARTEQNPPERAAEPLRVYFDGSCALCSMEIAHYASKSAEGQMAFVDVSKGRFDPGLEVSAGEAMRRLHVRLTDGTLVSGAQAFVAIWQELPYWRSFAKIARIPGAIFLLERAYRVFLPLRPAASRLARALGVKPQRLNQSNR